MSHFRFSLRKAMRLLTIGLCLAVIASLAIFGCSDPENDSSPISEYTYWRDVEPIIEAKCANCHGEEGIGIILTWLEEDAPEGDPAQSGAPIETDSIELPDADATIRRTTSR